MSLRSRWREIRAVEMATAGLTYDQIAQELGYATRSGAWKAVSRALRARRAEVVDAYVSRELRRLDRVEEANWERALAGDFRAAERVLGVVRQREALRWL